SGCTVPSICKPSLGTVSSLAGSCAKTPRADREITKASNQNKLVFTLASGPFIGLLLRLYGNRQRLHLPEQAPNHNHESTKGRKHEKLPQRYHQVLGHFRAFGLSCFCDSFS